MWKQLIALLLGALFGLGLAISGMLNPGKVLAFLDLAGEWDPSLALVMAGAILVAAPAYRLAKRRSTPVLASETMLPTTTRVDPALVVGALLFGIGWGLVGLCPGPALASLGTQPSQTVLFTAALVLGSLVFDLQRRLRRAKPP